MPFVYHKPKLGVFGSDNPFVRAKVQYQKVEEGLWCLFSEAYYKENISFVNMNDKNLSSEYYLLYLEVSKNSFGVKKNTLLNGVSYASSSWVMLKPYTTNTQCCFKDCEIFSLGIYFTEKWVKNAFLNSDPTLSNSLKAFMESDSKMIIWSEKNELADAIKTRFEILFQKKNNADYNPMDWNKLVANVFGQFFYHFSESNFDNKLLDVYHIDRKKIQQVERLLSESLQGSFIGIDKIAAEVGLSPTKLKSNFKLVYGDSIFQYFRKKQLESAKILLTKSELPIKDIALLFGYKSSSKFSIAYKNYFGILPSSTKQ